MTNLPKDVEILDASSENFKDELLFALSTEGSSSDYHNDRERPYNGQSHTTEGIRGQQEVKGLTMRDLKDCLVKAFFDSCSEKSALVGGKEFNKCWDFSECDPSKDGEDAKPTQYLLDKIKEGKYVGDKLKVGNWRSTDLYKMDLNEIDPLALCQNFCCEVEKMMGIFPNVPELINKDK